MKCPYSYELIATDAFCTMENLIDPAELLRLIEKARKLEPDWEVMPYILSALSGDPSALQKLAGE